MYRIRPFRMYGQPTFATRAGAMLQKAIIPFGVEGGTRSRLGPSRTSCSTSSTEVCTLSLRRSAYEGCAAHEADRQSSIVLSMILYTSTLPRFVLVI